MTAISCEGRDNENKDSKRVLKDRLVAENLHVVRIIAFQVARNLPHHIDVNDLIGAGTIGLIESAWRFDPDRGVRFATFASIRVRGAIIDELRGMDWMTRTMRENKNRIEWACSEAESRTGRPAEAVTVAAILDIHADELDETLSAFAYQGVFNLEDLGMRRPVDGGDALLSVKDPDGDDPIIIASCRQVMEKLVETVERLPERERLLIALYYYEEMTLKEVGSILDLSESRVCQLHAQTMHRLRASIQDA